MKNNMLFIGDKQVDLDNNTRITLRACLNFIQ